MKIDENYPVPTPVIQCKGQGNISLSTMNSSEKIPSTGSDNKKRSPQNGLEINDFSVSRLLSKKSYTEVMVHRFKKLIRDNPMIDQIYLFSDNFYLNGGRRI